MSSDQGSHESDTHRFMWNLRDDITYVVQARDALLQHPSRSFVPQFLNAAFCRVYTIVMVAYVEYVFKAWVDEGRDKHGVIGKYLKEKHRQRKKNEGQPTHDTRLETLQSAFASAGILVDPDVLADYSAIERLRNSIVHSNVKEAHKAFIERQGFPSDPAKLNSDHFNKIHRTMQELLDYLERDGGIDSSEERRLFGFASPLTQRFSDPDDRLNLVRLRDIPGMLWLNLERISVHIRPDIRHVITNADYSWQKGLTPEELARLSMSNDDLRVLEYLAARKASEAGVLALTQHRHLGDIALESWQEFWRQSFELRGFTIQKLKDTAEILAAAHKNGDFYHEQFIVALRTAGVVDQLTRNTGAVGILAIELPIIDPSRTDDYLDEAEKALCALTLMMHYGVLKNWRDSADRDRQSAEMLERQQTIDFYWRMIDAYRGKGTAA